MRRVQIIGICFALAGATPVLAQTGVIPPPNLTAPPPDRVIPDAPIGHRQPRAGEIAQPNQTTSANSQDPISREDEALDRKIKGICRGC